ncbi:MAG: hypothetical protein KTR25_15660 [Myxococcales bacterium]|nr:hypothetical protein [Myxococcales bacterium]
MVQSLDEVSEESEPAMDFFCVDIESSGPTPGMHNLLSIGVTHVRKLQGSYQPLEDHYVELRPIFPDFDDAAMRVNGLDVARLESEGFSPEKAMCSVIDWVEHQSLGAARNPVFVAHNAPFDWMFFAYYVGHTGFSNPFGFSALDTKALAMGLLGIGWEDTSLKNIASLVGAEHPDPTQLHHAGEDARHTARVFSALMNQAESRVDC